MFTKIIKITVQWTYTQMTDQILRPGCKYCILDIQRSYSAYGLSIGTISLTLDDHERSKIKVILFDVKCVTNGKSYDVRPMGFTLNYLEKLRGQRSRSQSFDLKYLENSDR